MGIRMIRQPSETPNVTNIDDIIPFRYAYGNQNGIVIGKGTQVSYTIDGSIFRVNSGRVVLQGVETDIDANGVSFTIDNADEARYYSIYYEVNLATQTTAIKLSNYSTSGYPTIDVGDDLTQNSTGIARLELYRFTSYKGNIRSVFRVASPIKYYSENTIFDDYDLAKLSSLSSNIQEIPITVDNTGYLRFYFKIVSDIDLGVSNPINEEFLIGNRDEFNIYKKCSTILGSVNVSKKILPNKELIVHIKKYDGKLYIEAYIYNRESLSFEETSQNIWLIKIDKTE